VLDNSYPTFSQFDVRYRVGGVGAFDPLELGECPEIFRGAGEEVEIEVGWRAGADHLAKRS